MKGQSARQPSPQQTRAHQPGRSSKLQSPENNGLPPEYKDWTPDVRRLDPRGTRPQDPASRTRTRTSQDQGLRGIQDFVGSRTSWDLRLRGNRDFMGFKTSRDLGLRGIQDFAGQGTSWDLGLCRKRELYTPRTRILFCGVHSENTNFPDKFKTWTPLGIRLVVSIKLCVLFLWLLGARTLPTELYRAR